MRSGDTSSSERAESADEVAGDADDRAAATDEDLVGERPYTVAAGEDRASDDLAAERSAADDDRRAGSDADAGDRADDEPRGDEDAARFSTNSRDEDRSAGADASDRAGSTDDRRRGDADDAGYGARDEREDRRRGGEGARAVGGRPTDRRGARPDEPDLPEDVQASDLDPAVRRDLLSLDKNNAETVARHMVMAVELLEDDPRLALAHARAARQRAGRIAVVRETAGVVAYHAEEWAEALSELRTARRMSGGSGLLAVMADCERGLGRPERAIELGRSEEAQRLSGDEASELRIVVAGARMDLGQFDQAVVTLQTPDLDPARTGSAAARLFYAYADALVAAGRTDEGLQWFLNAAAADVDGETDAEDRAAELTGDAQ
ncbi:hypothetical protein [Nocardia neocaledoniensis]|uniref:hypothetical protein n=1 Tax=Nocardia neocaledoniensis TaxID=236511 RepID=UPI0035A24013